MYSLVSGNNMNVYKVILRSNWKVFLPPELTHISKWILVKDDSMDIFGVKGNLQIQKHLSISNKVHE